MIKECPTCKRTYPDSDLAFCIADGALLSAPFDPQATQVLPEMAATELLPKTNTGSRFVRWLVFSTASLLTLGLILSALWSRNFFRPSANTRNVISPVAQAGTPLSDPNGFEFVYIPPGEFVMGSPLTEADRRPDEPQVQVTLTKGFYIGKYEVTQAQWRSVMGASPSYYKGNDLPVEQVSWDDAQEFVRVLNSRDGGSRYRLPTEAEWEYACRAGGTGPFSGDIDAMAWYNEPQTGFSHPVGRKKPNAWGIYDMHGNVWEWVEDAHDSYSSSAVTDPKSVRGLDKVCRGGSFGALARNLRCAYRNSYSQDYRFLSVGFRLARNSE